MLFYSQFLDKPSRKILPYYLHILRLLVLVHSHIISSPSKYSSSGLLLLFPVVFPLLPLLLAPIVPDWSLVPNDVMARWALLIGIHEARHVIVNKSSQKYARRREEYVSLWINPIWSMFGSLFERTVMMMMIDWMKVSSFCNLQHRRSDLSIDLSIFLCQFQTHTVL